MPIMTNTDTAARPRNRRRRHEKSRPVKERRAAEIVGVVTWLILTPEHQHCDHRYLMPRQI